MNMFSLLEAHEGKVNMAEVENSFGGNICRCTGYRPILDAMKSFAVDSNIQVPTDCQDIEDLLQRKCPKSGELCAGSCQPKLEFLKYNDASEWHWPKNLTQLYETLSKLSPNEEYMLVAGNTAHGVYRRAETIKQFIDINSIGELKTHELTDQKLKLGANLSLSEAMDVFKEASNKTGFEYCSQLWNHFDLIANVPVRNVSVHFRQLKQHLKTKTRN